MGYVQQILLHKITNFIYKICNNEIKCLILGLQTVK